MSVAGTRAGLNWNHDLWNCAKSIVTRWGSNSDHPEPSTSVGSLHAYTLCEAHFETVLSFDKCNTIQYVYDRLVLHLPVDEQMTSHKAAEIIRRIKLNTRADLWRRHLLSWFVQRVVETRDQIDYHGARSRSVCSPDERLDDVTVELFRVVMTGERQPGPWHRVKYRHEIGELTPTNRSLSFKLIFVDMPAELQHTIFDVLNSCQGNASS